MQMIEAVDKELQIKLQLRRKSIDLNNTHDINKLVSFFNQKNKPFDLKKQEMLQKIKEDEEKNKPTVIETLYQRRANSHKIFQNTQYNVPDVLSYLEA